MSESRENLALEGIASQHVNNPGPEASLPSATNSYRQYPSISARPLSVVLHQILSISISSWSRLAPAEYFSLALPLVQPLAPNLYCLTPSYNAKSKGPFNSHTICRTTHRDP
ncbi:Hypothetical protein NTJ_00461 [Nesidiocoris tenuis]|uniref:Uncharacterized protein n=1 Tax=Nesidiocoris tenuis TaxID=355587 RepID=A0ABN7A649_9HEMI|nr:Hypothetical protein NTJ_00461 [Nesidiocoris tenuis]